MHHVHLPTYMGQYSRRPFGGVLGRYCRPMPANAAQASPAASSSLSSPLTLTTANTHVLRVVVVAIAQGDAHHARTGLISSSWLISSPPAHSMMPHWSTHACHFWQISHLLMFQGKRTRWCRIYSLNVPEKARKWSLDPLGNEMSVISSIGTFKLLILHHPYTSFLSAANPKRSI